MRIEALATAMCLSTDATGVLVQQGRDPTTGARRACKKGHYFVQIADRDAVFFEYTEREASAAVVMARWPASRACTHRSRSKRRRQRQVASIDAHTTGTTNRSHRPATIAADRRYSKTAPTWSSLVSIMSDAVTPLHHG